MAHTTVYNSNYVEKIKGSNNTQYWIKDVELRDETIAQWVSATAYPVNMVVAYDGDVFKCISATTSSQTTVPHDDTMHWKFYDNYGSVFKDIFDSLSGTSTTDEKLRVEALTESSGSTYVSYSPILAVPTATAAAIRQIETKSGFVFSIASGTTRTATFQVGGYDTSSSTITKGTLVINGAASISGVSITVAGTSVRNNLIINTLGNSVTSGYLVTKAGSEAIGSTSTPVYINATGEAQVVTSISGSLVSGNTASATTGISIEAHTTGSVTPFGSGGSGSFSAAVDASHVLSFSHSHTAASGGTAVTVVTSGNHTITDTGHTHAHH